MTIEILRQMLPDYAKDIRLNLSSVLSTTGAPGLSEEQILGIAMASAYATKSNVVVDAIYGEASLKLDEATLQAIKAATVIMAMNNIYYRFVHLTSDQQLKQLPAKLRMNIINNPGVDKMDFELYSLAVSAINGCGMCMDAHAKTLLKHGVSHEGVQSAIRIAAVIHAAAQAAVLGASEA